MYLQMVQPDFEPLLEPFPVISASFQMQWKLHCFNNVRRMVRRMRNMMQ